ncbi:valine--tRNA ligase [Clostridia bacterium]|nr:valine--tRNA ligase [Clostridia bacterium]
MKEIAKNFDYKSAEARIYKKWLEKNYFHAVVDKTKKPFSIVMPPPNITGQLHLGHALNLTIQDILIRSKKMQGYNALWMPGCDHASIATEVKIVQSLAAEGVTKESLGREGFLERAWQWKETYGGRIFSQFKRLGCACDWERERFTMDAGLSRAVQEVFIKMYNDGKIYHGEKLINWCPKCRTTISDAEVDHVEKAAHFWHLKYKIDGAQDYLCFATTRPETALGDTAIAVNPADSRYTALIGKTVTVPIVDRRIPIIADEYVDMEFGTGVVKITPAHDPNDYEMGLRHKLDIINVMNDDGTMNENAGKFCGLTTLSCREKIVEEFKNLGLFVKTEALTHNVGTHERCGEIIEPLIRKQWFVRMKDLAIPAIDAYTNKELNLVPDRFGKIYLNWLNNIRDWCISRQLWWGHRIPAYYCDSCGEVTVAGDPPKSCPKCGHQSLTQDEDVLDTWFSSALWAFSTLNWLDDKEGLLDYFYPTSVLVTGYDIIFFWVIRMVFSGIYNMGQLPFKDVLFTGIIRDEQGRKMSKSLGNGIDPVEIIDKYGADVLRVCLLIGTTPGGDSRFKQDKVESARNFTNKLWNATRFILMFDDGTKTAQKDLTNTDKWILSTINNVSRDLTANLDNYELGLAVTKVYNFIWDEFCDWYIEMVKPRLYNNDDPTRAAALYTLKTALTKALKLLHPFMPFITEEIFTYLQDDEESLLTSEWSFYDESLKFEKEESDILLIKEAIKSVRNIRVEKDVPAAKKVRVILVSEDEAALKVFAGASSFFRMLCGASEVETLKTYTPDPAAVVSSVITGATLYLPLNELVDAAKEKERLQKEISRLAAEITRAESKLSNEGFTAKAPQKLIDEEKSKLAKYRAMLQKTNETLQSL